MNDEPLSSIHHGYAAAAYFGGRAEVRVRLEEVPVAVVDVTSMYPTVFILQDLQQLLASSRLMVRDATDRIRTLTAELELHRLYDSGVWPLLNCFVLVEPCGEIFPVRMRIDPDEPFTIAVTHFSSSCPRWYTLADVLAAKLLGGNVPKIIRAIEVYGEGAKQLASIQFRNEVAIDPRIASIFSRIVEERQEAKAAKSRGETAAARLNLGLKLFANSGAYGIFAEVNVVPNRIDHPRAGHVYSDTDFPCNNVHDERHGSFANFPIASLVTGGARLILAMLEAEVTKAGGTFAFCDTDSLAIVCGDSGPEGIPLLHEDQVQTIIGRFGAVNPYDRALVPNLLKREYPETPNLHCFAVSAKRYVLFTRARSDRLKIIKASESGLGAIFGRTDSETTTKLARRIWLGILSKEVPMHKQQRARVARLTRFDIPLRRKLPLSQPQVLLRSGFREFNRKRSYDKQMKPFGFLQAMTVAIQGVDDDIQPVAPFERDLRKCRNLPWMNLRSGEPLQIDWEQQYHEGTVTVKCLSEYIEEYRTHPESKAGDFHGRPAGRHTRGLLHRLHLSADEPTRIGKEVDRLDEMEAIALESDGPIVYGPRGAQVSLKTAIEFLSEFPQRKVASDLGMSERRWRDIARGRARPRKPTARRILALSQTCLLS